MASTSIVGAMDSFMENHPSLGSICSKPLLENLRTDFLREEYVGILPAL